MISFTCDYSEGAHPDILARLAATNFEQLPGYGMDPYCESAREKIRAACEAPRAEVFFLVGGTQTNSTVIAAMLRDYEGVVSAETGHIGVHESCAEEPGPKALDLSFCALPYLLPGDFHNRVVCLVYSNRSADALGIGIIGKVVDYNRAVYGHRAIRLEVVPVALPLYARLTSVALDLNPSACLRI